METWEEDGEDDQSRFRRQEESDWYAGEGVMAGVTRGELGSAEKRTRVQTLSSFAAMINPSCKGPPRG